MRKAVYRKHWGNKHKMLIQSNTTTVVQRRQWTVSAANFLEPDLNGRVLPLEETHFFDVLLLVEIVRFGRPRQGLLLLVDLSVSLTVRVAIEDIMLQHEYQVKADGECSESKFGRITKNWLPIICSKEQEMVLKTNKLWIVGSAIVTRVVIQIIRSCDTFR